ncbi:MAG: hypothetical protein M0Z28_10695 [Rhodospirillales bacterium]|nr:hypothetical protein [Rhodospirillales bacterium]
MTAAYNLVVIGSGTAAQVASARMRHAGCTVAWNRRAHRRGSEAGRESH